MCTYKKDNGKDPCCTHDCEGCIFNEQGAVDNKNLIEVVRCKDCKHRPFPTEEGKTHGLTVDAPDDVCPFMCEDGWYNMVPHDEWFCCFGEKKEWDNVK